MNWNKKIALFVSLLVIASMVLANTPIVKKWWNKGSVAEMSDNNDKGEKDPNQMALLNELSAWLQPFDSTNTSYYLDGLLTAIDRKDSAHAIIDMEYRLCKNGSQFYLRMGQSETINTNQLYLLIDHEAKKIVARHAKRMVQTPGIPVNDLYNYMQDEGYTLYKKEENGQPVISVQNPNHLSCKEFTVQYDSVARQVKKIFIRQADIADYMNENMEKWITLVIKTWNDDPDTARWIRTEKFVTGKESDWITTAAFQSYELMKP